MLSAAAMVLAGVTCTERLPTDAGRGGIARVDVVPQFSRDAAEVVGRLASLSLTLDNIHIRLTHADGSVALDTVVTITPDQDSVVFNLSVTLNTSTELLGAVIEIRSGTQVLFSGTQNITVVAGTTSTSPPAVVPITYSGPGAGAVTFSVTPKDSLMKSVDSLVFRANAQNAQGQAVAGLLIDWRVNPSVGLGVVNQAGVFKPTGAATRGTPYIVATLPTGLKDSALISIMPAPTAIAATPVTLSGTVGAALANPVVFTVRAADSLPVQGVTLNFAATAGGGSVAPTSAVTDANGQASTVFTLGPAVGTHTLSATAAGLPAVTVSKNVTAVAGAATKLVLTTRPLAAIASGATFSPSPQIRVADAFDNTVVGSTIPVTVSTLAPHVLLGTFTVNAVNGVVTFANLGVSGPIGFAAAKLTFSGGGLTNDTASATVTVGAPSTVAANTALSTIDSINGSPAAIPSVLVKDGGNNPVPGVIVKFRRHGGAGGLMNGVTDTVVFDTTGTEGIASLASRVVQSALGVDSVLVTAAGVTDTMRFVTTVLNGKPHHMVLTSQPAGAASLVDFSFGLALQDRLNNLTATLPSPPGVTVAIKGGTGTASAVLGPNPAALTKVATSGVATFTVRINLVGTGYQLEASSTGLPTIETNAFNITQGAPTSVTAVLGDNQSAMKGAVLSDSVVLVFKDAGNNPVAGVVPDVIVSGGGGELGPGVPTDTAGRWATQWTVGTSGAQTLQATAGAASATLQAFIAERFALVTEPQDLPVNDVVFSPQPKVRLVNAAGNQVKIAGVLVQASRHLLPFPPAIPPDLVSILSGTTSIATDANGEAQFTDLKITGQTPDLSPQSLKLQFRHSTEVPTIDSVFSVTMMLLPGAATQLGFTSWPGSVGAGGLFSVTVKAKDGNGNTAFTYNGNITVAIDVNPEGGTLSGTLTQTAVNGVATFDLLSINNQSSGYTLRATAAGLTDGVSGTIDVVAPISWQTIVVGGLDDAPLSCGKDIGGTVYCWGSNHTGEIGAAPPIGGDCITNELGDGLEYCRRPMAVSGLPGVSMIAVGHTFGCALADGGAAWCWGLGSGSLLISDPQPAALPGGKSFSSIVAGARHACGIELSTSLAWCWGDNGYGQLGDSTFTSRTTPTAVFGEIQWTSLAAGENNTCGVSTSGVNYCWGDNFYGQLGDGTFTGGQSEAPRQVSGISYTQIAIGTTHGCSINTGNQAYCWGSNLSGELGDGTLIPKTTPTYVPNAPAWSKITTGTLHTCAIAISSQAAYCWGNNVAGQLGDNTMTDRLTPTLVHGDHTWASITAGPFYTCGVTTGGVGYCWGYNLYSQLGSGLSGLSLPFAKVPTAIAPQGQVP